jgi:hypothetical protein
MRSMKLAKYLAKRKNQGTVILCFKILLDNIIENGTGSTMLKSEIHSEFDKQHKNYGIGTFRSDYLLRQSASSELNAIGVKSDNTTFFINQDFIDGLETIDLKKISDEIKNHFNEIIGKQVAFFEEIKSYLNESLESRKLFIQEMLTKRETDKKGQSFEVTSFAILKTFYKIRGFELNRFSTVYSNDGGVDFASQTAVYQVTTSLSPKKFEEDLQKAPLKQRIFVYKTATSAFDPSSFEEDLVLDHISSDDLLAHLDYMFKKKPEQNSQMIINVIITEFEREYYL